MEARPAIRFMCDIMEGDGTFSLVELYSQKVFLLLPGLFRRISMGEILMLESSNSAAMAQTGYTTYLGY
jgi:hypothetical protein